jgi:hypothetical protein
MITATSENNMNRGLTNPQKIIKIIFAKTMNGNARPKNDGIQNLSGGI